MLFMQKMLELKACGKVSIQKRDRTISCPGRSLQEGAEKVAKSGGWIFPGGAISALKQFAGFRIVDNLFFVPVPLDAATGAPGEHAKKGQNRGAMSQFDAGDGGAFLLDGIDKICPEEGNVVAVGFLQLRFLMNLRLPIVAWVKGPTVAPADMKDSAGAVEIGTDGVFLGGVTAELAVFPYTGEFFELVSGDLMVGSVGGLFLIVKDRSPSDGSAASTEDAFGIFFFRPPKHLVEPVDTPVTEGAVGVIEKISPAAGVNTSVEGTHGSRTAPLVPIHRFWRGAVGASIFLAAVAMCKQADHADFADFSGFEELHGADVMRRDAAVKIDLDNAAGFARSS